VWKIGARDRGRGREGQEGGGGWSGGWCLKESGGASGHGSSCLEKDVVCCVCPSEVCLSRGLFVALVEVSPSASLARASGGRWGRGRRWGARGSAGGRREALKGGGGGAEGGRGGAEGEGGGQRARRCVPTPPL